MRRRSPAHGPAMRLLRWIGRLVAGIGLLCLGLAVVTLSPGDPDLYPGPEGARVRVVVIDHGYHTGIVLPRGALRQAALAIGREEAGLAARLHALGALYPKAEWIEVGWGDAAFYQATPGVGDIDLRLALRALFLDTPSAVQVVPGVGLPDVAFAHSGREVLILSEPGFEALARRLAESLSPPGDQGLRQLGPSLYGGGTFVPSGLSYHALRTCNHWTSWLLRAAGVPSSWFLSTTSAGLMAELSLRAK